MSISTFEMRVLLLLLVSYASAESLWPAPLSISTAEVTTTPLDEGFHFSIHSPASPILAAAFVRAEARLRASGAFSPTGGLSTVAVSVASADQTLYFGVNESYSIRIFNNGSQATITAATVYGALHAIESLSSSRTATAQPRAHFLLCRRSSPYTTHRASRTVGS